MFCRLIFRRHSSQKWAKKLPRDGRATPFNENCIVFCCVSSLHELMWWEKTSKPDWTKEGEGWPGATWNLFMNQKDGETTFDCMPELSQLDRDYRLQVFMCVFSSSTSPQFAHVFPLRHAVVYGLGSFYAFCVLSTFVLIRRNILH